MAKTRKDRRFTRSSDTRYGKRKVATRTPRPRIAIICDDSVTAPKYFRCLQREFKDVVRLDVVPASQGKTSARAVVDRAIDKYEHLEKDDAQDAVWVVIDKEHEDHKRKQAKQEQERAKSKGVKVALSDPCFEVWTLLHLQDTGESFTDCAQVIDRLKQLWKNEFGESFDSKTQIDCAKIIERRHEAYRRAKKHHEANDPSWTEVYKVIEAIESLDPQRGSDVA